MKSSNASHAPGWHMGRLMELATGYWKSAVLSAAVRLDLFEALEESGSPAPGIAQRLNASPEHVAELLDALTALDLLIKSDDVYRLHPDARPLLIRSSPSCILDALRFNIDLYPLWGNLADCINNGEPVLPPSAHLGGDPERTRRFVMGMHGRALGMAPSILPRLDLSGAETVLDVASGPGTFSRLLAERHAHLRVTQTDLPPVLDVARELTQGSPAADRIAFHPADYRKDALPDGFDAALLIGAIHQEDASTAGPVLASILKTLKPGGVFYLVDMMLNKDRTGPLFSNLFSLNMRLTSPRGRVFADVELVRLMDAAGFAEVESRRDERSPYWMVAGRKAANPNRRETSS